MPVVDKRENRSVSFAADLIDPRQEDPLPQQQQQEQSEGAGVGGADPSSQSSAEEVNADDGTGRRFKIQFQEHRLRFDQMYPEGINLRIPQSEYEIVLEQIHRELMKPVDKSQKSVRKWSAIVAGTAPVGVGFVLSAFLARRVNRHQKALKNFWISLRNHLKALNRDIYYARGIEWRIERDMEKINERDVYNKLLSFRMEVIFRKPITLRSGREVALHSVAETNRTSALTRTSTLSQISRNSRFSNDHLADPVMFALLATVPEGENLPYSTVAVDDLHEFSNSTIEEEPEQEEQAEQEDMTVYSSPFLVPDHIVVADDPETHELFVKEDEPAEVAQARATSTFEPPSPTPAGSVFIEEPEESSAPSTEVRKMTFADLLRTSPVSDGKDDESGSGASIGAVGLTAAMAAASLNTTSDESASKVSEESVSKTSGASPYTSTRESREEAFAQRQRKKFSREPTLATQLYAIPESPKLGADEDPVGDALTYLNASENEDDIIEDMLSNSAIPVVKANAPLVTHIEDVGPVPVAAYPMADPFSPLYETDAVTPVNIEETAEDEDEMEFTDVDGEVEYVRRKKWRVDPENADKLARVQTMSESIHPSSRRASYLPLTTTKTIPKTINFDESQ